MEGSAAEIIKALKKARLDKGLSQSDLAKKLGIPQSHLSKIEGDKINPTIENVIELARVLDLELVLVPKRYSIAVNSLIQMGATAKLDQQPAYRIKDEDDEA
jgi:transcriptional regulator with XRE-family HTH domain